MPSLNPRKFPEYLLPLLKHQYRDSVGVIWPKHAVKDFTTKTEFFFTKTGYKM